MRLIDADELKRDICNYLASFMNGDVIGDIVKIIDNAQTVERPQGKWIDPQNVGANNWCSICGEFILHYNGICNYCSNCGASMKKGGAE